MQSKQWQAHAILFSLRTLQSVQLHKHANSEQIGQIRHCLICAYAGAFHHYELWVAFYEHMTSLLLQIPLHIKQPINQTQISQCLHPGTKPNERQHDARQPILRVKYLWTTKHYITIVTTSNLYNKWSVKYLAYELLSNHIREKDKWQNYHWTYPRVESITENISLTWKKKSIH